MKRLTITLLVAVLAQFLIVDFARAGATPVSQKHGFEAIVSATKAGGTKDIEAFTSFIASSASVSNIRYVFSPDEQNMLRSIGRGQLAAARKFTLNDVSEFARLKERIGKSKWQLQMEPAEIRFLISTPIPKSESGDTKPNRISAKFDELLWGLNNLGQKVSIALDDLTSYIVQGIKGEDIGVTRAKKENPDPAKRITIAVLDTGVDFGHPEMEDQLVENVAECRALAQHTKCLKDADAIQGANATTIADAKKACDQKYLGKDFDGNGYPLDCSGWNVTVKGGAGSSVWGDNDASDKIGHGTHIAGILSATSKDGDGIFGVIQNARILPVKVITTSTTEPVRPMEVGSLKNPELVAVPSVSTSLPSPDEATLKAERGLGDLVARGMLYAIRSGAQVINMSLGWPADVDSNLMAQMIDLARSRNILVVAAAGNDGTDALIRPCIFEGVICVASHDPDGAISHFSNHGAGVDIAAPGLSILSLHPTALRSRVFTDRVGYEQRSGTSMAAPFVAGVLARLLNSGFTPQEAHARILASARAVKPNPRVVRSKPIVVQSGNVDLGRALSVSPRPLILPTTKKPILAQWNRMDRRVGFQLELKNLWSDASQVTIRPKIVEQNGQPNDASISQRELKWTGWTEGEKRSVPLELSINDLRLDSEQLIALEIESVDQKSGKTNSETRYLALEIVALPSPTDREVETKNFTGDPNLLSLLPKAILNTIQAVDGATNQDYLAIHRNGTETKLILLREANHSFVVESFLDLPTPQGNLMLLQRLDLNGDGSSDYVFIWKQPPTAGTRFPVFTFRFYDRNLRPLPLEFEGKVSPEATYSSSVSVITDKFQWIAEKGRRFPAWISRGTTPESEKPSYNPWNPKPLDLPNFRLYVWGAKGLKSINLEDKTPVAFLPPSRNVLRSGKLKTLWVSGVGTDQIYEISEVYDNEVKSISQADFGGVRTVRPNLISPVFDLSRSLNGGEVVGAALASESFRAAQRVTGYSPKSGVLYDSILKPLSKIDAVAGVLAGFTNETTGNSLSITQTIYELQVHEAKRNGTEGVVTSTSLKKFSFLPGFFIQKLFYPVVGYDSENRERAAMLYLAQGLGNGPALEVTAIKKVNGQIAGLSRPARLRMIAPQGCESMGDPLEASNAGPARVAFICSDRVMFVPLTY